MSGPAPGALPRSPRRAPSPADDAAPTRVLRIDPAPGTVGVFGDAPVVALLTRPVDGLSVAVDTFQVTCDGRPVEGTLRASPDGRAIVWTPLRPLAPGAEHHVRCAGLRDSLGRPVLPYDSAFVPCAVTLADLFG